MSAGLPEHKTIFDAAGIDAKTANTYDKLLADLYVAEQVPARPARSANRSRAARTSTAAHFRLR